MNVLVGAHLSSVASGSMTGVGLLHSTKLYALQTKIKAANCPILSKMSLKNTLVILTLCGSLMFLEISYAFRKNKVHKRGWIFWGGGCTEAYHYCLTRLSCTVFREPLSALQPRPPLKHSGSVWNTPLFPLITRLQEHLSASFDIFATFTQQWRIRLS